MIKFFRHIRLRLLTQASSDKVKQRMIKENPPEKGIRAGRISKYLLYAIGEIVLVVFGILIALQINNWNESRKDKELVRIRLSELVQDLELDLTHFKYHLELAEEENHRIDSIYTLLSVDSANQDLLMSILNDSPDILIRKEWVMIATTEYPLLHQKTFLSLQNSGQLALFDTELQQSIGSFYGYNQKYSFMIEEIIKNKNIVHADFVRTIPYEPSMNARSLNEDLMNELWINVDKAEAGSRFISLLNTYHELNLKSIYFNNIRLYKTNIMIDEINAVLQSDNGVEIDQKEASDI